MDYVRACLRRDISLFVLTFSSKNPFFQFGQHQVHESGSGSSPIQSLRRQSFHHPGGQPRSSIIGARKKLKLACINECKDCKSAGFRVCR